MWSATSSSSKEWRTHADREVEDGLEWEIRALSMCRLGIQYKWVVRVIVIETPSSVVSTDFELETTRGFVS